MSEPNRNNRTADLLSSLEAQDGLSLERLAFLANIPASRLRDCRDHRARLTMVEQLAIANVIGPRVPRLAREARHVGAQAAAGMQMQDDDARRHLLAPPKWT